MPENASLNAAGFRMYPVPYSERVLIAERDAEGRCFTYIITPLAEGEPEQSPIQTASGLTWVPQGYKLR